MAEPERTRENPQRKGFRSGIGSIENGHENRDRTFCKRCSKGIRHQDSDIWEDRNGKSIYELEFCGLHPRCEPRKRKA